MRTSIRHGLLVALALTLVAGPLLATAASASPVRQREKSRVSAPDRTRRQPGNVQRDRGDSRGPRVDRDRRDRQPPPSMDRDRRGSRPPADRDRRDHRPPPPPVNRDRRDHRDYRPGPRHHHGSGVGSFLGGVALGAILGGHPHVWCGPPPPPPRPYMHRVYVYDCDWCDCQFRNYDAWVMHLVDYHGIPPYEIDEYFPPYARGHWEFY